MSLITRRTALTSLTAAVIGAPAVLRSRFRLFAQSPTEYSARAVRLMGETTVIDLLNQFRFPDFTEQRPPKSDLWMSKPNSMTEADWKVYQSSGIHVFSLGAGASSYEDGLRFFANWNGLIAGYSDWFTRIDDVSDFARVRAQKKVGVMITMQDSSHFRTAADVDTFWALGQRLSQLTYNFNNRIGSGFLEERDGGLSVFGRGVMARMEQVGMAVDVSHCGDQTTLDALEIAKKPVVFSHATCRALLPKALRCKTDEQIKKMAASGGVMGINFIRFMDRDQEPVTIEHVLDHFDYVRKLVGVQYLAVGSDLDVVGNPNPIGGGGDPRTQPNFSRYLYHEAAGAKINVEGLDHPKRMFDLTEGLIRRGYSDADIQGILGGNAQRVLGTIWPKAVG